MASNRPIACSLSAADRRERLSQMSELGRDGLDHVERAGDSVALHFRPGAATRARLEAIVAGESECCPFLEMRLSENEHGTTLTVRAPEGAGATLDDLVAAFAGLERRLGYPGQ